VRWYRWTVVIVGRESGRRVGPLMFVRFRHRRQAIAWCNKANAAADRVDGLTYFEAAPMP